ncbi:hypothetical protein [Nocardia harenae]|uniref:hypothetical protein n=1 Tax=Nocardia harenae TaxID=358707 RepID=UPI000B040198|nr:hypothetical protein [Nocardia harenae]
MSARKEPVAGQLNDADRVAEYVAELVAQAPPISGDARDRLAALLGAVGTADRRAA